MTKVKQTEPITVQEGTSKKTFLLSNVQNDVKNHEIGACSSNKSNIKS